MRISAWEWERTISKNGLKTVKRENESILNLCPDVVRYGCTIVSKHVSNEMSAKFHLLNPYLLVKIDICQNIKGQQNAIDVIIYSILEL